MLREEISLELALAMIEKGQLYIEGTQKADCGKQVAEFYNAIYESLSSDLKKDKD